MDDKLWDEAVAPLLRYQSKTGRAASLGDCVEQARWCDVRVDLVILLVRNELPLAQPGRGGLYPNLVVSVATSHNGGIYRDDAEALEALQLVAHALDQTLTVQVIDR